MCESLTLATRGPRLLPNYPAAASEAAEQYLRRIGVTLLLNTDGVGLVDDFDVVIDCSGHKVKADSGPSLYLKGALRGSVAGGQIRVNKYLQV